MLFILPRAVTMFGQRKSVMRNSIKIFPVEEDWRGEPLDMSVQKKEVGDPVANQRMRHFLADIAGVVMPVAGPPAGSDLIGGSIIAVADMNGFARGFDTGAYPEEILVGTWPVSSGQPGIATVVSIFKAWRNRAVRRKGSAFRRAGEHPVIRIAAGC